MIRVTPAEIEEGKQEHIFFLNQRTGSFTQLIFAALSKADPKNFYKLSSAYPGYGYAVASYQKTEHLDKFFVEG